jgi:hypothetical protein
VSTPGLQDLLHSLPLRQGNKAQTHKRVEGNAGDTLVARTCVLVYFSVVENKSSHLSIVDYQITKIYGFLKGRGGGKGGKASQSRPVKR